jgi:hypothetical protein
MLTSVGDRGRSAARHRAVIVQPHQADHVADIILVSDSAGGRSLAAGEDWMVLDPSLREQLPPLRLFKEEVG